MWKGQTLTVVFPAFNEEKNIARAVESFLGLRDALGQPLVDEVLVVDNNSTDATAALAIQAGARVVREYNQGYGFALMRGLDESRHELVALCEPDGTFMAQDLCALLSHSQSHDVILGTRTVSSYVQEGANMRGPLRWGNIALAALFSCLYLSPRLTDCGCTFRLITRRVLERLRPRLVVGGSHFLMNFIIAARLEKLRVVEVPVSYCRRIGESKITGSVLGTFRTAFAMLCLVFRRWPGFLYSHLRGTKKEFPLRTGGTLGTTRNQG